jgi:hypothetical protein
MPPAIEEQLRAHVARTLATAGVSAHVRDDLLEELLGHLFERWAAHVANGMEMAVAADRAIADFGVSADIGRQLGRTYHSRLWASTVGVLLPGVVAPQDRPSAIRWLRFVLGLMIVLNGVGAAALAVLTPIHLLAYTAGLVLSTVGLVLAFIGLGRAQSWALIYAACAAFLLLVLGLVDLAQRRQPGEILIPVGTILAAIALLVAYRQREALARFVAGSSRPRRALSVALSLSVLAPLTPLALEAVPDPTQATAQDMDFRIEMTCDYRDLTLPSGELLVDAPVATVVLGATWAHTDLLPLGLARFLSGPDDADTVAIRINGTARAWLWSDDDGPTVEDVANGQRLAVGTWGSTAQSNRLLPDDVIGSLTVGLERHEVHPGHTVRTTWELYWFGDGQLTRWPTIDAYYAHLDRFLLAGSVTCNGIQQGHVVDPGSVKPAEGALPALPTFP